MKGKAPSKDVLGKEPQEVRKQVYQMDRLKLKQGILYSTVNPGGKYRVW